LNNAGEKMKNQPKAIVLSALVFSLLLSGCSSGQVFEPTMTPPPTIINTPSQLLSTPTVAVSPYIGLSYPPVPEGWQESRGSVTYSANELSYSIQDLRQEDKQMLWFLKSTRHDANGSATWIVLDVLVGSGMKGSGGFVWFICQTGDKPDTEIVVLGESSKVKVGVIDIIHQAWRASHETEHFVPISTTGIICVDDTIYN
jgi:hypothetical protein